MRTRALMVVALLAGCSGGSGGFEPIQDAADAGINTAPVSGPVITVTSPAANTVIAYDTLRITAKISSPSGRALDASSIQVRSGPTAATMSLDSTTGNYAGQLDISGVPSGKAEFTVTAADVSGASGSATVAYVHDRGPLVTFLKPGASCGSGSVTVEITVDDPLYPVTTASQLEVTLVDKGDVVLAPVPGATPFRMSGTIDLAKYPVALDGELLLTAVATNSKGTQGRATRTFLVDGRGPEIVFVNPLPGQFIGGVLEIRALVDDLSGVDDSTVVAVLGANPAWRVPLKRATPELPLFSGFFHVSLLGTQFIAPNFSIRATDTFGNQSELSDQVLVDNVGPLIALDPPTGFRLLNDFGHCSRAFDPVGQAINDGDLVRQVFPIRARIEDRGNFAPDLLVTLVSRVHPAGVNLYVAPVANAPLTVDTDGDGTCDDINPDLIPVSEVRASNEAVTDRLVPVTDKGRPDFTNLSEDLAPGCVAMGVLGTSIPDKLCGETLEMTTALHYLEDYSEPAIWAIPRGGTCSGGAGLPFDSLNHLPEGPTCVAVRATDYMGNRSVSPPLRVCIDRGTTPGACAGWPTSPLPDCTGTVAADGTVSRKPCDPGPNFPANKLRRRFR